MASGSDEVPGSRFATASTAPAAAPLTAVAADASVEGFGVDPLRVFREAAARAAFFCRAAFVFGAPRFAALRDRFVAFRARFVVLRALRFVVRFAAERFRPPRFLDARFATTTSAAEHTSRELRTALLIEPQVRGPHTKATGDRFVERIQDSEGAEPM